MKLVIRKEEEDEIISWWCYYTSCDTCPSRFKCFTSSYIVDNCIELTERQIITKLRTHGFDIRTLPEF